MDQRRARWAKRAKVGLVGAVGAWALGAMQAQQALLGRPTHPAAWAALGALGALAAWMRPGPDEHNEMLAGKRPPVPPTALWLISSAVTLGGMLALLDRSWVEPPPGVRSLPENWLSLLGAWAMFAFLGRQVLGWLTLPVRRMGAQAAWWLSWSALVAGVALSVASAQNARWMPHGYPETLRRVGTFEPASTLEGSGQHSVLLAGADSGLVFDGMVLYRQCDGDQCAYEIKEGGQPWSTEAAIDRLTDERVEVLVDDPRKLLVLRTDHEQVVRRLEYRRLSQPLAGLRIREVRAGLAVPRFWLASAVVGQVAALVMMTRTRRWRRLLAALRRAREGEAHEGHVAIEGQGDVRLPEPLRGVAAGTRVTVLASDASEGYRSDLGSGEVLVGTASQHRQRVRRRLRDHVLLAGGVVLLTSAPLVTAWALGLR